MRSQKEVQPKINIYFFFRLFPTLSTFTFFRYFICPSFILSFFALIFFCTLHVIFNKFFISSIHYMLFVSFLFSQGERQNTIGNGSQQASMMIAKIRNKRNCYFFLSLGGNFLLCGTIQLKVAACNFFWL